MTDTPPHTDRFDRNLAVLSDILPSDAFSRLAALGRSPLRLVRDGGDINLHLGPDTLYAGGAMAYAAGQVARYLAKPNRLSIDTPDLSSPFVKGEAAFYRDLIEVAGPLPPDPAAGAAPGDVPAGALVSFGLGLGLHLPLLAECLSFQSLVIVEPVPEFVVMSAHILDWAVLVEGCARRGGTLSLHFGERPAILAMAAFNALRDRPFARLDGSFGFRHYASPAVDETDRHFREMLPTLGNSKGFVVDECLMLSNALANLGRDGALLAPAELPGPAASLPVLVVGSGPSLDTAIQDIHRLKDGALIISGGTALGALLENGIRPDLHCEVENVPEIHDGLAMTAARHDLSGIPLLCAATVDPRLPDLFGPVWLYFQQAVTPSLLFSGAAGRWPHAAPTVTNLALRAASWMGSRQVALFGVDLGAADAGRHHSESSYYNWTDDAYWRSGAEMDALTIPVPGNFRDEVMTNIPFLYTRSFFNAFTAAHPAVSVVNCSDGARIEGAEPRRPAELTLKPLPGGEKDRVIQRLSGQLIPAGGIVATVAEQLDAYEQAAEAWHRGYMSALADAQGLEDVLLRTKPLFAGAEGLAGQAAQGLYGGTAMIALQYAFAHYRRLDSASRPAFEDQAIHALSLQQDRSAALFRAAIDAARGAGTVTGP